MKEFWRRLTAVRRLTLQVLLISLAINVLGLASSIYSIQVLNRYLAMGIDGTLITLTVGALLALLLELIARSSRMNLVQWLCARADRKLANASYHAISQSRFAAVDGMQPEVRREALSGLNTVQMSFGAQNLVAIIDGPFGFVFLVILFLLNSTIGFVVSGLIALVILLSVIVYANSEQPTKELSMSTIAWSIQQSSLINNPELVRAFPSCGILAGKWKESVNKVLGFRKAVLLIQAHGTNITYAATVLQTIIVYAVGAREAIGGNIDVGTLIGINILASRAMSNVTRILQLVEPVKRGERSLDMLSHLARLPMDREQGMELPVWRGNISFDDMAFAYAGQPAPLIESFDLEVPAGNVVVVKGGNGAGKTTFARMLVGLLDPTRGRIRIDSMDLRQAAQPWWCQQFMYFPQEPSFFDGTLAENLAFGNKELSPEKLMSLCREVGLGSFLENSADGLHSKITNNAHALPVGIRRRLALVRALAVDSQLAIFDEPTEAIDTEGCIAIAAVLNRLVRERKTIFVMTNDPFIVKSANIVVDLNVKPQPTVVNNTLKLTSNQSDTDKNHVENVA